MKRRKTKKSEVWVNHEAMQRLKDWVLNRPSPSNFEPRTDVYPDHPVFEEDEDPFAA